jgi:hypothetical protein
MQLPLAASDGYVRAFGEMFGALAEKNHAALIPYLLEGVGGDPGLNRPDLVHPNAAGQRILAENVWRVLEPILRKKFAVPAATNWWPPIYCRPQRLLILRNHVSLLHRIFPQTEPK